MDLDQFKDPWQFDTAYIFNPFYNSLEQSAPIKSLIPTIKKKVGFDGQKTLSKNDSVFELIQREKGWIK